MSLPTGIEPVHEACVFLVKLSVRRPVSINYNKKNINCLIHTRARKHTHACTQALARTHTYINKKTHTRGNDKKFSIHSRRPSKNIPMFGHLITHMNKQKEIYIYIESLYRYIISWF